MIPGTNHQTPPVEESERPAPWRIVLAFGIVYLGYGLNFLAIKAGVDAMPAFIFAGSHILGAGLILMLWIFACGGPVGMPTANLARAAFTAVFLFVGGVGLVTQGEKLGVPSGVAAIIKSSVPLWVAAIEAFRPKGEKPGAVAITGLLIGALGVAWLVGPRISASGASFEKLGIGFLVLSALLFAIGSIFARHRPPSSDPVQGAMWMMVFGGLFLFVLGAALGEFGQIGQAALGLQTMAAFLFLLFVHSLAAFTAMNWLLRHLPASIVTTKFYVSPAIAVGAGWFVLGEPVGAATLSSLILILVGVGVVFSGQAHGRKARDLADEAAEEF